MSAQIRLERKQYYDILEKTQKGNLDITDWIVWFLNCLINALKSTDLILKRVLFKADFWQKHIDTAINDRQRKLLNKLMDESALKTSFFQNAEKFRFIGQTELLLLAMDIFTIIHILKHKLAIY